MPLFFVPNFAGTKKRCCVSSLLVLIITMQEKHSDVHVIAIAALVFVAASAILQTAIGLNEDKLSAVQSQQMFATVVAAAGPTTNQKVDQFAKQFRSVEISENGHARIRGIVSAAQARGIMLTTWGGQWKVLITSATKLMGQRGKLDPTNIKVGDYVMIEGIVENNGASVVSGQTVMDYTVYRAPTGKTDDSASVVTNISTVSGVTSTSGPSVSVTPLGTPATNSPKLIPMRSDGNYDSRTLTGLDALGGPNDRREMKARYNLSMDPNN